MKIEIDIGIEHSSVPATNDLDLGTIRGRAESEYRDVCYVIERFRAAEQVLGQMIADAVDTAALLKKVIGKP